MRLIATGLLCGLVGCAMTPQQVLDAGPRTTHDLQLDAPRAAGCIGRNADNLIDSIQSSMRPLPENGRYEVLIRNMNAHGSVLLIAHVAPRGASAVATMIGPGFTLSPTRAELIADLVKGC